MNKMGLFLLIGGCFAASKPADIKKDVESVVNSEKISTTKAILLKLLFYNVREKGLFDSDVEDTLLNPLLLDCVKNDTTSDRVRLLLELGANPNYTIEEKANLNLVEKDFITVTYVSDIHTPLLEAAKNKKPYLIPLLVAYGAELDYQYAPADGLFNFKIRDYEQNLFINAKEDITTIKALIVAGGNIKTQDTNGFNVIQKISLYDDKNDYKTLDFLLAHGADLYDLEMVAVRRNMSDDFLQWLSQKGVNFDIDFMNRAFDHNNYHFLDYCEKTYPNEFQHFIEYYDACTHIGGRVISSEQLEYLNTKRTLAVCVPTPCLHTEEVKPSETWSHWVKRVGTLGYVK